MKFEKEVNTLANIVLQPHHTGIEMRLRNSTTGRWQTFNRTILELKWLKKNVDFIYDNAFNRTILELK